MAVSPSFSLGETGRSAQEKRPKKSTKEAMTLRPFSPLLSGCPRGHLAGEVQFLGPCPTPGLGLGGGRWDGGFRSPPSLEAVSLISSIKQYSYPSVSHTMIASKYLATSIFGMMCGSEKGSSNFLLASGNFMVVICSHGL